MTKKEAPKSYKPNIYNAKYSNGNPTRCKLFPKQLSGALSHATKNAINKRGFGKLDLLRDWKKVVGNELASHCQPIKITPANGNKAGCLYIQAKAAFILEVQYQEPVILERLATYYGYRIAQRINLTASTPK